MAYKVFISYRRDGASELAQLLYTCLKADGYEPFFDVEKMRSGKFNTQLYDVINECDDLILLLPEKALAPREGEDWVRLEIEHALKEKKNIVPVLMRGFQWPDELPEEINEVRYCHGITANMEYFEASYKRLKDLLHSQPSVQPVAGLGRNDGNEICSLLNLADFFLQNCEFEEASRRFEKVLAIDAECGTAYLGKYMAEHGISNRDTFRMLYENNIVYNDLNLKLAQQYANDELKSYFSMLSLPKCSHHGEIATQECDICKALMCGKCVYKVENDKKNICPDCVDLMRSQVVKICNRNSIHCILHLLGVGLIIALATWLSSGEMKTFFIGLGVFTGIVFTLRQGILGQVLEPLFDGLGEDGGCIGFIISLVLLLVISAILAPILLLLVIVRRIYWLIFMRVIIHVAQKAEEEKTESKEKYVDVYYKLIDITYSLGLHEPSLR